MKINLKYFKYAIAFAACMIAFDLIAGGIGDSGSGAGDKKGSDAFDNLANFVEGAATGSLGRAISIIGGTVGMIGAAASGRLLLAGSGMALAIFGVVSPNIIKTIFSAII